MAHLMYTLAVCWAYLSMTLVVYYNSSNPKHLEIYADTLGKDLKHLRTCNLISFYVIINP